MPCRWMSFAASSEQDCDGLVSDTTALSHFARADRTDELRIAAAGREPILLAEVASELARGIPGYPSLGSAAAGAWLKQVELEG
jgi:hypothetical protein